jgi:hypothetical protein
VAAEKIAGFLDCPFVLRRREPRKPSEFVREAGLIVKPAREREVSPIDMAHPLRNPMHVLEPEDAAERFRRQSCFGPEDRQEPPMSALMVKELNASASQQLTSRCRDSGGAAFCAAPDSGSDRDRGGIVA